MIHKEFQFKVSKTRLFGQYWQSDTTKMIVLLVHGMGEYSTRYTSSIIPIFLKHSISVISYDQFGHGKTQGKRGHNPSYEAVLDCVEVIRDKAITIFGDVPIVLYGHSMGGNVVINYVLRREHSFVGVIATSPFLRLAFQPPSWKLSLAKLLQKIAPSLTMSNELDTTAISRDKLEVKKYNDNPLIHNRISANYSLTFIDTGEWAIQHASQLEVPMLVLHGTEDRIISYKASKEFVKNTNEKAILKLFEGAYHELHNDLCRNEMIQVILNWMRKNSNA